MKKITQTGRISINSIGLIFSNYLRWFKVFCVFYIVPTLIIFVINFTLNKEKFMELGRNLMLLISAIKTKNFILIQAIKESLVNNHNSLVHSPSYILFYIISMIIMFVCFSCLLVGLKHTFYQKISIKAIAKEGFSKALGLLWTGISMWLMILLTIIVFIVIFAIPTYILGDASTFLFIPILVAILIGYSMFVFYIPIHFFADNNPMSSALLSCKTFWNSFIFIVVFKLLSALISTLICGIVIGLGFVAFFVLHNNLLMILSAVLIAIVMQYVSLSSIGLYAIATFIAYPELLDEDKTDGTTQISFNSNGGGYPSLPTEFFDSKDIRKISNNNISSSNNSYEDDSAIRPTNGGEGLSIPKAHQNNRPFLNQKLDQTEFDRLTSRDQN